MLVYVDTSVFGGVFDPEFERGSHAFFDSIRSGRFRGAVSALVTDELVDAPSRVRELFTEFKPMLERLDIGSPAFGLRRAYLEARVVNPRWAADALHVARHGDRLPGDRELELPAYRELSADSTV